MKTSQIIQITANNASPVILVHGGAGTISTDTYQDKVRNKPKMAYSRDLADMDYHRLTYTNMDCHGIMD